MASTMQVIDNSSIRAQLMANLRTLGLHPNHEVILARTITGSLAAWVVRPTSSSIQPIIRGPACATTIKALEALLEATADMIARRFAVRFAGFEEQLSTKVGEAFVLDSVLEGAPSAAVDGGMGLASKGDGKAVDDWERGIRTHADGSTSMLYSSG